MHAYIVNKVGGPEALELTELSDPIPTVGQVKILIKAFGLNRAEAVTRMGGSGKAVKFPRVIGIECVGEVLECPGGELTVGQKVCAAMGEMGRAYHGSYAEQVVVPSSNVFPIETKLDWVSLAAIPETYFTAWGCCFEVLKLDKVSKPKVVVRPGASALGIAVTQIVNHLGGHVIGITRSAHKAEKMKKASMHKVIVSSNSVADQVRTEWPDGADGIIDTIVSKTSLRDNWKMRSKKGRVCLAGSLSSSYGNSESGNFLLALLRPRVWFYNSGTISVKKDGRKIQDIINRVETGHYQLRIDGIFDFSELREAHRLIDENAFVGKAVVKVGE